MAGLAGAAGLGLTACSSGLKGGSAAPTGTIKIGFISPINSSVVGLTSDAGISGYATAKHAQVGLMRTVAKEVAARGIRVNTLHPGPTDTDFQREIEVSATGAAPDVAARLFEARIPLSRHACPEEIARCVLFLACADSSFVTGATLAVDGGMQI
jgi:NAD(P)-dependent dehydrogenase (short-subunit alcohol dehydrogenase family)